jgi:hypothetical protein
MSTDRHRGEQQLVEGEVLPPFQVLVNGVPQPKRYRTYEEARASVRRLDVNVEIFERNKRVFGKPLPDLPPRSSRKRRR